MQSEALLQMFSDFAPLSMKGIRFEFAIETNGVRLDAVTSGLFKHFWTVVMSPKPPSSKNDPYDFDRLWEFLQANDKANDRLIPRVQIKPVVMDDADLDWIIAAAESREMQFGRYPVGSVPIILQTWVDPDNPDAMADLRGYWREKLTDKFIEWMGQHSVRLLPRLHNLIWGNEQGY